MTALRSIAFYLYCLALLPGFVYGILYLNRNRFMPYHAAALGRTWDELDLRLQTLLIGLLKIVGGCMFTCSTAGVILLWIPFRVGDVWTNWTLLAIVCCAGIPAVYSTFLIHAKTGAATPRAAALTVPAIGILAFLLAQLGR